MYACFLLAQREGEDTLSTGFGTRTRRSHIDPTGGSKRMVRAMAASPGREHRDFSASQYRTKDGRLVRASARGWLYVNAEEKDRLVKEQRIVMDVRPGTVAYLSPDYYAQVRKMGQDVEDGGDPGPEMSPG